MEKGISQALVRLPPALDASSAQRTTTTVLIFCLQVQEVPDSLSFVVGAREAHPSFPRLRDKRREKIDCLPDCVCKCVEEKPFATQLTRNK